MKRIATVFLAAFFGLCLAFAGQVMAEEAVNAPVVQKADVDTKATDTVQDKTLKPDSNAEKTKHEMNDKARHEMKSKTGHGMHEMQDQGKHEMKGR
jgi:hypothetical protein